MNCTKNVEVIKHKRRRPRGMRAKRKFLSGLSEELTEIRSAFGLVGVCGSD